MPQENDADTVQESSGNELTRRDFLKTVGSAAVGGALLGSSPTPTLASSHMGGEFKVGAVYPFSGAVAETGQNIRKFIKAAANIVNKKVSFLDPLVLSSSEGLPNLGGAKVKVIFADHRGDPGQGRAEAERLVQEEGVDMLVGGYHSSVTKTISQVAEREQVPHVNFESSSPNLTERGFQWFWRTGPHDLTFSTNMFQFFQGVNERGWTDLNTAAIIHEDTEFGQTSAETQMQLAEEYGFEVVAGPISYTAETVTSLEAEVQRIKSQNPDVLLPASYLRDSQILMRDMKKLNYYSKVIMAQNAGFSQPSFVKNQELSDYVCNRSTYSDDLPKSVPEIGKYNDYLRDKIGVAFNGVYIRSWGGFMSAMKAVDNAGSKEPRAIQRALNNLKLQKIRSGLPFGVQFGSNHQNKLASGVLIQYRGGDSQMVWPFDLAGAKPTIPAPSWDER